MRSSRISSRELLYLLAGALGLGAILSLLEGGDWLTGFWGFGILVFIGLLSLVASVRWAGGGKTLAWIVGLAFILRLAGGVATYTLLPAYGYTDEDDRAGYVFTDAHRRDDQAWELARSDRPVVDAFFSRYAYDQYGGLLAFSSLIYRYLSPDVHRPLMLILISGLIAALGIPFLWRGAERAFGARIAWAATWIFALYPDSILLGGSAMREPYIMTMSAFSLWGFVDLFHNAGAATQLSQRPRSAFLWLGLGLLGMLLISPAVALATLVILAGWLVLASRGGEISWKAIIILGIIFFLGLFLLSSALNRSGEFDATSPLHVINDWLRLAVQWDAYQLERESGWVQKLFNQMPDWMRLPFIAVYGVLQHVLPAALIAPTLLIWKVIYITRALGWYALLPLLSLSFLAARQGVLATSGTVSTGRRALWTWLALAVWFWILLAAIRGGGDQWDNPRYRTLLFLWQAILAGYVWVWWRETRNPWLARVIACEIAFLLVFTQWYASRYFLWGGQLPFAVMVLLIVGLWAVILGIGWWLDQKRA